MFGYLISCLFGWLFSSLFIYLVNQSVSKLVRLAAAVQWKTVALPTLQNKLGLYCYRIWSGNQSYHGSVHYAELPYCTVHLTHAAKA